MTADAQGIVFVFVLVVACGIVAAAYSQSRWLR